MLFSSIHLVEDGYWNFWFIAVLVNRITWAELECRPSMEPLVEKPDWLLTNQVPTLSPNTWTQGSGANMAAMRRLMGAEQISAIGSSWIYIYIYLTSLLLKIDFNFLVLFSSSHSIITLSLLFFLKFCWKTFLEVRFLG